MIYGLFKIQFQSFKWKKIEALDMPSQDLSAKFAEGIAFIKEGIANGGVLVHW